jgi:hypothetical protein
MAPRFKARAGRPFGWLATPLVIILLLVTFVSDASGTGRAAAAGERHPVATPVGVQPVLQCSQLVSEALNFPLGRLDLSQLPEAPTRILSATVVPAAGTVPEYCQLKGYIQPQIQFEMRLPTTTWNGRYFQTGCGGFCGNIPIDRCGDALSLNFAVAAEDSGHTGGDGLWGRDNQQLRTDFGSRSSHAMSVAAKEIIEAYYGQRPARSYFRGCSMGGRQAFVLAERFPDDFDGILAGHPAFQALQSGLSNNWLAQKGRRDDQSIILTPDRLKLLHDAVMAQCDGLDGLVDGLLDDPRNCHFDPATVGLTGEELKVARSLYAGPHTKTGLRVYPGWVNKGSELDWLNAVTISTFYANNGLRFLLSKKSPPLSYTYRDFDFNKDVPKLRQMLDTYDVINPSLTKFRESGGKFMLYHGWSDTTVSAMVSVDIYHEIAKRNGGADRIGDWFRLFMVPGMFHCGSGPQTVRLDPTGDRPAGPEPLTQLADWVERGEAPDKLVASYLDGTGKVLRTRPSFPYPLVARYTGSGSVDDAANFVPAEPPVRHDGDVKWIWDPGKGMSIEPV